MADALARHVKLLAHFFQRVVGGHFNAKAHAQHLGFARGEAIQDVFHHIAQARLHGRFHGRDVVGVLDEVAQVAVVIIANRGFHRDGFFGDFHDLADLVLGHLHLLGQQGCIGLKAKFLQVLARQAIHLVDGLDHVHRNANGAGLVGNRAGNGLADPPRGVGREFVTPAVFELVHRLHQANVALLNQIEELQAPVGVLFGNRDHQAQVGLDHLFLGKAAGAFTIVHALVNALELFQRHHHAVLQVDERLLQLLHIGDVAPQDGAVGLVAGGLLFHPLQVQQVGWEVFDELLLAHAAFIDNDFAQLALFLAHIIDLGAGHIAQLFDGFGRKANGHQLFGDGLLHLDVGGRAPAVFVIRLAQLLEQHAHAVKALQRVGFELFQQACHGLGAAFAVVIVVFVVLVEVFFGHIVVVLIGIDKAIDNGGDDHLAFADVCRHFQHFGNRGGRGGDGLHHVHQAALDALGDFDFALAREQLHRAHFTHVHAHGVGGAAKFTVHGGQGRLGLFLGFFFGRGGLAGVVQQQGLGIGRLLVHRHAHVAEHGDHHFQRFGIDQLVGQVVVDFSVGQVAARLAQLDQLFQALAAGVHFFFGEHRLIQAEFLHQGAFLGLADFHAQGFDFFHTFGRGGGLGFGLQLQVGFDVAQIGIVIQGRFAFAFGTALGAGLVGIGGGRFGGFCRFGGFFGCSGFFGWFFFRCSVCHDLGGYRFFAGGFFGGRFFCGNNGFRLFGCYCFFSCSRFFYGLFSINLLCSCFFVSVSRYFFCCRSLGFGFFTGAFGGCFCQQRIGHGFEFSFGCHLHSFLQYPPARQRCMGCT